MNFKLPMWSIAVGHLLGISSIFLGFYLVLSGTVTAAWLLLWIPFHFLGSLMTTVGLHRYFSHGSFKTSVFWHKFMAYYSVLLLNGSPFGWSTAHITHHVYADTKGDPHLVGLSYLLWKRYNNVHMVKRRLRHLIHDDTLALVHRYGGLMWLGAVGTMAVLSWKFLLFGYLMSLGSVHIIGGLHQVSSHKNGEPRNLPWMEFILPACGEWMHRTHHDHSGRSDLRTAWWHLDLGALFIKCIRKSNGLRHSNGSAKEPSYVR